MSISSIDYTFDFDDASHGLSGTIAVLNPRAENPQQAFLVLACYRDQKKSKSLEITADKGIWSLTVPTEKGRVTFEPQLSRLSVFDDTCDELQKISFENQKAIVELDKSLQKDNYFYPLQAGFLEAINHVLPDIESNCYLEFDLFDEDDALLGSTLTIAEKRRRRRKRRRHEWEVQISWELSGFIKCMKECEEDCSWWEIWWHAWCLGKCLVKCARGGNVT